jgi:hypothetical protein
MHMLGADDILIGMLGRTVGAMYLPASALMPTALGRTLSPWML